MVPGAEGAGELVFNRDGVSVREDEDVLKTDEGEGSRTAFTRVMLLSCALGSG